MPGKAPRRRWHLRQLSLLRSPAAARTARAQEHASGLGSGNVAAHATLRWRDRGPGSSVGARVICTFDIDGQPFEEEIEIAAHHQVRHDMHTARRTGPVHEEFIQRSQGLASLADRALVYRRGNSTVANSLDQLREEIGRHNRKPGEPALLLRRTEHRERVHRAHVDARQILMGAEDLQRATIAFPLIVMRLDDGTNPEMIAKASETGLEAAKLLCVILCREPPREERDLAAPRQERKPGRKPRQTGPSSS